jgi:integrase
MRFPEMRTAVKLTKQSLAGLVLPKGKAEALIFDDDIAGFGLRIRAGGSAKWVFQYRLGAKQRRLTLGSTKAVDPGTARKQAELLHAKVKLGLDPAGEKAERQSQAAETFEAIMREYLKAKRAQLKPRGYLEVERYLLIHAKPLHRLQLAKIERRNIASLISGLASSSGRVAANRARASLSGFFAWAIRRGLVDVNPVMGTERQDEKSRERVLSDDELRSIWSALGDDQYGAIVKLLMLTGQRAGEIGGLRWGEIVDDSIILPPERVKNARTHIVPLSGAASAIIEKQVRRAGRDLVFGWGEGGFQGWSNSKEALDKRITEAGGNPMAGWVLHDLRRTVATRMNDLGIAPPHVIEAILNHVSGHKAGVAGVYNRSDYAREKKNALALWAEHLRSVVDSYERKVDPLRLGAASEPLNLIER